MLVRLPHGMVVNPEIVKLVHVRADRAQGRSSGQQMIYSVVIKTDDDGFLVLAATGEREAAEALAYECAQRINLGLGEEDPNVKSSGKAPAAARDDDDDDDLDDDDAGSSDDGDDFDDW